MLTRDCCAYVVIFDQRDLDLIDGAPGGLGRKPCFFGVTRPYVTSSLLILVVILLSILTLLMHGCDFGIDLGLGVAVIVKLIGGLTAVCACGRFGAM